MRCYTKAGDSGETCIFGGKVYKHDERIDAIGTIDELNAFLGVAASFSENQAVKRIIQEVQNDIFSVGAELATVTDKIPKEVVVTEKHVKRLEALIDKLDERMPKQTRFIIPAGTQAAMFINIARTVARRAERILVKLDRKSKINPELLKYANRLSSLLYMLSRYENNRNGIAEKNPVYHHSK